MAIQFAPPPGLVLICDYSTGFKPPEMVKRRPALVLSPRLRHRDGLCTVVPLSTTPPERDLPYQCRIVLPYAPPAPFAEIEVWAKADMLATVSYRRLDLFHTARAPGGQRRYIKPMLAEADLERVRACVRAALGF